ncbi:MAG TPA: SRPBCC family protein [Solirubrobacterales bacterium]
MGSKRAEQSAEVDAPTGLCFETIVDYETFPEWQRAVKRVEVHERDAEGRGKVVEFHVDIAVRKLRYVLDYHYEPPHRIWWDFVEGDYARDIGGEYRLEPREGATLATYSVTVEPAVPVPGFLARRLEREMMKRSVEDLRREAERRARG